MASPTVHHSSNGTKLVNGAQPQARVIALLGPQVDHLFELRALSRRAQDEERRMTAEVLEALQIAGLDRLAGQQAVAIVDERSTLRPNPQLFAVAVGPRAWGAMTVSVTAARKLLGEDDLQAISEITTSPVLRVEPLPAAPAA